MSPEITIAGSNTGFGALLDGIGVDATGTLYVANTDENSIAVFAPGASGNVAPERTISGPSTGLGGPDDVIVGFNGQIYVTNGFGSGVNSVTVYAPAASGDATPVTEIKGLNTGFGNPDDMAVDTSGDIFVTDESSAFGPAMLEFSAGSNGNVAPSARIAGSLTTLSGPEGVAVAGPPATVSSALSSKDSASTIALGSSTSDTATLTGGSNAPTGSLEFKLFGNGDTGCTAAPVFTSPFVTVHGNGSYTSPSFVPTTAGTYRWVALYSGDSSNAAASTACGAPDETVTVTASVPSLHLFISAPYQDNGVTVVNLWWTAPPGATTFSLTATESTGIGPFTYTATGLPQFGVSTPFVVQVEGATPLFSATFQVSDNLSDISNTVSYP